MPEDDENDNIAKLNLSMYGTREAASAWQAKVIDVMKGAGFVKSTINPCIFHHGVKVHRDDDTRR